MIWRRVVALLVFSWSFLLPAGWAEKRWVRVAAVGFWGFGLLAVVLGVVMLGAEYDPEFGEWFGLRWGGNDWVTFTLVFTYYLLFLMQFGLLRLVRLSLSFSPGINLPRLLIEFCWNVGFFLITFQSQISSSLFLPISLLFPIAIVFMMVFGLGLLGTYFIKLSITSGCVLGLCCICFLFSIPFLSPFSYKYLSLEYMFLSRIILLFPILTLLYQARHLPRFLIFSEICQIGLPRESDLPSASPQRSFAAIVVWNFQRFLDNLSLDFARSRGPLMYKFARESLKNVIVTTTYVIVLQNFFPPRIASETQGSLTQFCVLLFALPCLILYPLSSNQAFSKVTRKTRAHVLKEKLIHPIIQSLISTGCFFSIIHLIEPDAIIDDPGLIYLIGFCSFLWFKLIPNYLSNNSVVNSPRLLLLFFFQYLPDFLLSSTPPRRPHSRNALFYSCV